MGTKRVVFIVLAAICAVSPILAQSDDLFTPASISNFRFNFLNPGGRATAMGNAFIAQGNDATGSEINPAGLLFIPKPMLFAEYRYFKNTSTHAYDADGNRVIYRDFEDTVHSPTFISYVHPTKNWAFAVYRQELANFQSEYSNQSFQIPDPPPGYNVWVMNRQSVKLDFKLINWGATISRRLHETFGIGFSIRLAQMDFEARERVDFDSSAWPPQVDLSFMRTDPAGSLGDYLILDDSDYQVSFVAGFQYKPTYFLSIGGVYRYGEKHKVRTVFFDNMSQFNFNTGQYDELRSVVDEFEIDVPDRIGFGVSLMPTDTFTFNLDVVYITYEDLNDQFRAVINPLGQSDNGRFFGWENGTEIRLGGEYTIPMGATDSFSLRAGYYRDADPSIHYMGGADPAPDLLYRISNPAVGDDDHVTFGVGMVIFRNLQIDVAYDWGEYRKYFAASVMYNFGD